MSNSDFSNAASEIIEAGKELYRAGMVPATSGNFSRRLANGDIAITVSGAHKGRLTENDIMLLDASGRPQDDRKPSAEAGLHVQLYRLFPDVNAVLHPHARNAVLLSRLRRDFITLSGYELLKAFPGIKSHKVTLNIPIFDNDQDIGRLVRNVEPSLAGHDDIIAYVIAGHGYYTWGCNMQETLCHVEALDYLFDCELQLDGRIRE